MHPSSDIAKLLEIMAALRHPRSGCPWDLEQTHLTLAPYALEEAYEVVDAIERGNLDDLKDELGDLLLQVVFHARLAEEGGSFAFGDIVEGVTAKMVRRHPHVFDATPKKQPPSGVDKIWEAMRAKKLTQTPQEPSSTGAIHGLLAAMVTGNDRPALSNDVWEAVKSEERKTKVGQEPPDGLLSSVTMALPGLTRAVKLQKMASSVGFDWDDAKLVLAKISEEMREIGGALDDGCMEHVSDEIGDLLFAIANLARHTGVDPETAIRAANAKFERRFAFIEQTLSGKGSSPARSTLEEMDALWSQAKASGL